MLKVFKMPEVKEREAKEFKTERLSGKQIVGW
jgi:hypothetical protein